MVDEVSEGLRLCLYCVQGIWSGPPAFALPVLFYYEAVPRRKTPEGVSVRLGGVGPTSTRGLRVDVWERIRQVSCAVLVDFPSPEAVWHCSLIPLEPFLLSSNGSFRSCASPTSPVESKLLNQ
jgi:hypothetical protein